MNNAIKDQQYSVSMNIKAMIGDSSLATSFGNDTNKFYGLLSKECEDLGTKLKKAVENAYEKGWDFDSSNAVSALLKQQTEIQDKLATAKSEARLETLQFDFANGDLSAESYKTMMETAEEEIGKLGETYNQSRIDTIAQAALQYGKDSAQYEKIKKEANEMYSQKMTTLESKSLSLGGSSIMSAYKDEFEQASKQFEDIFNSTLNQKDIYGFIDAFNNGEMPVEQFSQHFDNIANAATQAISINGIQRQNIAELYEAMRSQIEGLREDAKNLEVIPQELQKTLIQADLIGAMAGDKASKDHLVAMTLSKSLSPEKAQELFNASEAFGANCPKGMFSDKNINDGISAADRFRQTMTERLSQPYLISADVKINFNPTVGPMPIQKGYDFSQNFNSAKSLSGHATGTPYFGGGLTQINEHGGEIINLPTGAQIIPSDKSAQMVKENAKNKTPVVVNFNDTPYFGKGMGISKRSNSFENFSNDTKSNQTTKQFGDINVNVNIGGNIIGLDNAADEIGSKVCERVFNLINAM